MNYLDFDRLRAIDARAYQETKPYPWINPEGLLREEGYRALVENLPDIAMFEKVFGAYRAHGQQPHDRYNLEYRPDMDLPKPWREFTGELTDGRYETELRRILGVRDLSLRFHWHYQPAGCSVSPHCDSLKKLASHLFYLNPEDEWDPSWGGQTLILDDGGRLDRRNAPSFEDFDHCYASQTWGNRSLLFTQAAHSWHGVEAIRCPDGYMRKVFIVVVSRVRPLARLRRLLFAA